MAAEPEQVNDHSLPGKGVLGWLGRQVGYVRRAVHHPVPDDGLAAKVYRQTRVEEKTVAELPNVKLRRTTIDELVIDNTSRPPQQTESSTDKS